MDIPTKNPKIRVLGDYDMEQELRDLESAKEPERQERETSVFPIRGRKPVFMARRRIPRDEVAVKEVAVKEVAVKEVAVKEVAAKEVAGEDGRETGFFGRRFSKRARRSLLVLAGSVVGTAVLTTMIVYPMAKENGIRAVRRDEEQRRIKGGANALPEDAVGRLNAALLDLRGGKSEDGLKALRALRTEFPYAPSLSYLVAIGALQAGDLALAESSSNDSIAKGERVSDALALQSVIEAQKSRDPAFTVLGDPKVRSEELLRRAAHADAANPYPHFELSTLLRYKGKREEALEELRAAQARLNPVDSHMLVDVSLAIMNYEQMPVAELPDAVPVTDDVRRLFPAAYAALRRGDGDAAVAAFEKCRSLMAPDMFDYLINDPSVRKLGREGRMQEFYQ